MVIKNYALYIKSSSTIVLLSFSQVLKVKKVLVSKIFSEFKRTSKKPVSARKCHSVNLILIFEVIDSMKQFQSQCFYEPQKPEKKWHTLLRSYNYCKIIDELYVRLYVAFRRVFTDARCFFCLLSHQHQLSFTSIYLLSCCCGIRLRKHRKGCCIVIIAPHSSANITF